MKQEKQEKKIRYKWINFENISFYAGLAMIAAEDQKFVTHHGFDLESIQEAREDYLSGKRMRGASTISQQVAKNLFLWKGKSLFRKGLEAYYTLLLELFLTKKRILEIYLNMAEFGEGIFGIHQACKIFFKKAPKNLSAEECALLAAVLPNPKRLKVTSPSNYIKKRQAWILSQMEQLGWTSHLKDLQPK